MRITRRFEIDAGHRLLGHEGKCKNLHGHRYVFELTVEAEALDAIGRVIDFSVLKEKVYGWVDEHWDHGFLVQEGDPLISFLEEHGLKHVVLPFSPTSENLAKEVHRIASELLPTYLKVSRIRCYETPNCWSEYP